MNKFINMHLFMGKKKIFSSTNFTHIPKNDSMKTRVPSTYVNAIVLAIACLFFSSISIGQTTYYYRGSGNLNVTSSWSTNSNGVGGTNAPNFTGNNQIFNVRNIAAVTNSGTWTVSGTNSKITVGDGTNATNLTIPTGTNTIVGTVDVNAQATLTLTNTTLPTLGTLNAASTVVYNGSAAQTITQVTYGNLTYSGSSTATFGGSGTYTIAGNFTCTSGNVTFNNTGAARTFNISGDFTSSTTGTIEFGSGAGSGTVNLSGDFSKTNGAMTTTTAAANVVFNMQGTAQTMQSTSTGTLLKWVNFTIANGSTCTLVGDFNETGSAGTTGLISISSGGTLVTGTSIITGANSTFTINSGGTLQIGSTAGITTTGATGNIQTSTRNYSTGANYVYNGTSAQVTGSGLTQNTPANITIDNSTSVSLSANTTITGNVLISQGTFSASASNFDITLNGNWTNNGTAFTGGSGSVTFTGTTETISGSSSSTFGDLIIDNGTAVTMSNNNTCSSLTFNASASNSSLTHSGTAALTVNGAVTINQPSGGTTFTTAWNINAGSATVSGLISMAGTNTSARVTKIAVTTGTLNANGGITLAGTTAANKVIDISGAGATLNVKGTITPATSTLTAGTNSTFNYNDDTNAQSVVVFSSGGYNNLNINTTGGAGATLAATLAATNITGNLSVQSGTFNNGGFAITLANNKSFSVSNAATFNLTGTSTMPTVSGTGTRTFGTTSIVNYSGTAQAVPALGYGNLKLSGSGNKTFAGSTTIATSLDISGTAVALLPNGSTSSVPTLSFNGIGQVSGSWGGTTSAATNKSAARFGSTTTGIINVSTTSCTTGDWLGNTSTDWFTASNWCGGVPTSSTNVTISSSAPNQPNINGAGAVCNNITINTGATLTITGSNGLSVSGNWTNNGTFTANTSTVTFTGSAAQTIDGSSNTAFSSITVNKSSAANTVTSQTNSFTASGNLTITTGILNLTATDADYTVTGNISVAANGTLKHSVSWDATGFKLGVGGNIAIDGAYDYSSVPRAHISMTGSAKTVHSGSSAFSILTLGTTGAITADGALTVNDNFWAMFGVTGGSFSTNGQTVVANAALLVSGGTVNINGGSLTITGGMSVGVNAVAGAVNFTSGSFTTDGLTIGDGASAAAGLGTFTQSTGTTATINGNVTINQQTGAATNAWNINAGTANVSGLITFAGTNTTTNRIGTIVLTTGTLNANGGITISGTTPATKVINLGTTGTLNLKGALTGASGATLTAGTSGSIFNYNDNTSAQTVNFFGAGAYFNLYINTTGGAGATLSAAISTTNVTGNLRVQSGTLNTGAFNIVGNGTRTFEVANAAFFKTTTATTNAFPTGFGTNSLGASSTVEYRATGAQTVSAQNYGNLTITATSARTVTLANAGTIGVAGIFSPAATLTTYTTTGSTVSFNGTTGAQNIPAFSFNNLTINNTSDVTLTGNVSVNGTTNALTFSNGKINTGTNTLTLASAVTVTTAGAGKYVNGKLAWTIPTGTPTRTFYVGDATDYTPATLVFTTNITSGGTITVNTTSGDHPNINTSTISATKSINRYWTIANAGVSPVGYTTTFNFINPGDLDAGVNTSNVAVQRFAASTWNTTTIGTRTSTSTQITGVTAFGDFQIGEICVAPSINTPVVTNISCNGANDGSIDITTVGGTTPFTYAWSNGATTEDISGLAPGNYSLVITASGGCTASTGIITITEPSVLNATVTPTNIDCNGANTGSIIITAPTGGYGNYEYTVNGGSNWQSSGSFTGLAAGTYDVRIRDADHTSCIVILNASLTLTELPVLSATFNSTTASCGLNDATLTFSSPSGGSGSYEFSINGGSSWQSSPNFTGLTPGSYNVQMRDANHTSCIVIFDLNHIINQYSQPDPPVSGGNQSVCFNGDPEQALTATATTSPTPPATLVWYDAASGGSVVSPPTLTGVGTVTYYAAAVNGACESITRAAVTLSILDAPAAPVSDGDQTVCYNGNPTQTLIANATSPATITWYDAATGGSVVSPPALIGIGTATYYAEASNGNGCTSPDRTPVTLIINPLLDTPGAITGPTDVCPFVGSPTPSTYSIDPVAGATFYTWHVPVGTTIVSGQGTTTLSVTFDNSFALTNSLFTVTAEAINACTSAPSTLEVLKNVPGIPLAINGPTDACPFIGTNTDVTYSIDPVAFATSYTWVVPTNVTLVSGQGTTSITVNFNSGFTSGSFKVTANSNCGNRAPRTLGVTRLVPAAPTVINGPTDACSFIGTNTNVTYSIDPVLNATSYTWTLPANMTLVSGQGTTSITVNFNSGFTTSVLKVKSVANCASSGDRSLTINVAAASTPGNISGPTNACPFIGTPGTATYFIAPVANATSYNWSVPTGATIVSHPNGAGVNDTIITVSFTNSFVSGSSISVQAVACVASATRTLTISKIQSATPGLITGATNVCPFMVSGTNPSGTPVSYTIAKVANATSYVWTVPSGATITGHPAGTGVNDTTITVIYSAGFTSGTVTVASASDCGTSTARSLTITRLTPGTPGAITTVNTSACPSRQYTYTLPAMPSNSNSILWAVPNGGTILSGQGSTSITVSYTTAAITGTVTATAFNNCATSSTRSININLPVCAGGKPASTQLIALPVASLKMNVYPNPTVNDFKLQVITADKESIKVRVMDMQGRELQQMNVKPYQTVNIGATLKAGTYFVEVTQGNTKKTEKLFKF